MSRLTKTIVLLVVVFAIFVVAALLVQAIQPQNSLSNPILRFVFVGFGLLIVLIAYLVTQKSKTWEIGTREIVYMGIGAALTIIGAGYGFGKIGAAALESMARQPEIANDIRGAMIVIAALLEGATFFALLICLLPLFIK